MKSSYDVVIVGGGIVGLTLACSLAKSGLSIAIFEKQKPSLDIGDDYDLRVSAINQKSQDIFKSLTVWKTIQAIRVSPFREVRVWDSSGGGAIHFDSANLARAEMGHIVENRVMQKVLLEEAANFKNIDLVAPVQLKSLGDDSIELDSGEVIKFQLIVGADGACSWVRDQKDIAMNERSYGHHALVATVEIEKSHQQTAWQRFLKTGSLAFLPLDNEHFCSIVWADEPNTIERLKKLGKKDFKQELEDAFESRLGKIKSVSDRASFPLFMRHAKQYVMPRMALIGDAAHTIHPLAGQGLNLGIADAFELAKVVQSAIDAERDFADFLNLRKYERQRKSDNVAMIFAMDGLKYLFASQFAPVKWARNVGLNMTNALNPVKNIIMKKVLGL